MPAQKKIVDPERALNVELPACEFERMVQMARAEDRTIKSLVRRALAAYAARYHKELVE